jgi:hypothetical protein
MIYQSINPSFLELLEYGRSKGARAGCPHSYPCQLLNPHQGPLASQMKRSVVSIETAPLIDDEPKKVREDIDQANEPLVLLQSTEFG